MIFEYAERNQLELARPISGRVGYGSVRAAEDVLAGMLDHLQNVRAMLPAHEHHEETRARLRKKIREHHENIRSLCHDHDLRPA